MANKGRVGVHSKQTNLLDLPNYVSVIFHIASTKYTAFVTATVEYLTPFVHREPQYMDQCNKADRFVETCAHNVENIRLPNIAVSVRAFLAT